MTTKGKAYANRKSKLLRPKNDLYETPECLVEELINTGILDDCTTILDPCCGNYAITNVLLSHNKQVDSMDIMYGNDFLKEENHKYYDAIVMNPPFTLWDNFLQKAKQINCKKIIMIGKTDYFSCHGRNIKGLWNGLKYIYIFDRKVSYDNPRSDNKINVGCLTTGWFIWENNYNGLPKINIIDIDKYVYRKNDISYKKIKSLIDI